MTQNDDCLPTGASGEERELSPDQVARHLGNCGPCSRSMDEMLTRSSMLEYLAQKGQGGTTVERVLASAAASGKKKLGDLLYTMTTACLMVRDEYRAVSEPYFDVPSVDDVSREMMSINARIHTVLDELPRRPPESSRAAGVAVQCLNLLEQLEGPSPRTQCQRAQVAIFDGDLLAAEQFLRPLSSSTSSGGYRRWSMKILLYLLVQQKRFADVVDLGEDILHEEADDRATLFNVLIAYAGLGDLERFDRVCMRYRGALSFNNDDLRRGTIADSIEWIAARLGRPEESVLALLSSSGGPS